MWCTHERRLREGNQLLEYRGNTKFLNQPWEQKKAYKYADKKPGPASVLTLEEEEEVINWIIYWCKAGFPATKSQLLVSVQGICKYLKKNSFTDDKLRRSWYEWFLKRHPEISTRTLENVCLNRVKVTEQNWRNWYSETSEYLSSDNLLIIEPERVFNSDETGKNINKHNNIYNIILKNDIITIATPKLKYFNLQEFLSI